MALDRPSRPALPMVCEVRTGRLRRQRRESPERSRPMSRENPSERPRRSLRVLVVDDNVDAADSIAMLIGIGGHRVQVAYDGPAALEMVPSFRPQVVLLDIGMPGMDGYQVARRLRQDPAGREAMLVAMTGWGQEEDRRQSKEAGFDRHLVKPAEPAVLEELLAEPTTSRTS